MTGLYDLFWRDGGADPRELTAAAILPSLRGMVGRLAALKPASDEQKQLISAIGSNEGLIQQTRLLMSLQLASPVSWPLLIVVASWSVLLFCGFGVLSRLNFTTLAALGFGAFAVASAVFLILEMSDPYGGLFRIPPGALEQTIEALKN